MIPITRIKTWMIPSICTLLIFAGAFSSSLYHRLAAPSGTVYLYSDGYIFDYFQYLSWIQQGKEGWIRVTTRYTSDIYPHVIVHPLFSFSGFVSRPFSLSSSDIYLILRVICTIFLLGSIYLLLKTMYKDKTHRMMSWIFLVCMTGLWTYATSPYGTITTIPITWTTTFSVIGKWMLPPHHLLGLTTMIVSAIYCTSEKQSHFSLFFCLGGAILTGFLNPSFLVFHFGWVTLLLLTRTPGMSLWRYTLFFSFTFSVLAYHMWLFQSVFPWSYMYTLMKQFHPDTTLYMYLTSLGPIACLSALSLFDRSLYRHGISRYLFLWAFTPIVLYPFSFGNIPINTSRLFQTYQYIPLCMLAPAGLRMLIERIKGDSIQKCIQYAIVSILFLYGAFPYTYAILISRKDAPTQSYTQYLPISMWHAFSFLDQVAPHESVILSGMYTSAMIPSFTHHRAILGRDDSTTTYHDIEPQAFSLIDGYMTLSDAEVFLKKHRITYLISGMDTPPFSQTGNASLPIFEEIFHEGSVSIVRYTNAEDRNPSSVIRK